MTRRLLLVRHGITTWNRQGRFQGHLDPPLDAVGELQARLLGERLVADEQHPVRIVTSPLQRAAATAAILAAALESAGRPATLTTDARLMEIGQGEWEGRTHAELQADDTERYAAWRAGGGTVQPPGGETMEAALSRAAAAVEDLTAAVDGTLCLVSHGGILRLAAGKLLDLAARRAWALDVDNAALSVLSREVEARPWRIDAWNDVSHLLGRTPLHVDEADGEPLAL